MLTSRHGTIPVRTAATAIYNAVQIRSEAMMPMGKIPLRILRLLRGGGNCVEPDIREEDVGGSGPDSGESVGRETRPVRSPVAGTDVAETQPDDEKDNRDLDGNDRGVEAGALLDANRQDRRDHQSDDEGRHVEPNFISEQVWRT